MEANIGLEKDNIYFPADLISVEGDGRLYLGSLAAAEDLAFFKAKKK